MNERKIFKNDFSVLAAPCAVPERFPLHVYDLPIQTETAVQNQKTAAYGWLHQNVIRILRFSFENCRL